MKRVHGSVPGDGADAADVIVVGAGPAGSLAALLLARRGLDVLLVDRAEFPRPKPCGDCLSAAATDLLHRHGLAEPVGATGPAWLTGWVISSPGGASCTGRFGPARGLAIERRVFDNVLRQAAIDAGARAVTGQVVDLVRDPGCGRVRGVRLRHGDARFMARLVVGADGLRSVVARRLGTVRRTPRLQKISLTAHLPTRHSAWSGPSASALGPAARGPSARGLSASAGSDVLGRMHVLPGGCVGYAPVGRGRANVTVVVEGSWGPHLRDVGPAAFFREWLERAPDVRDRVRALADESDAATRLLASGPFDWPSRGAVADGAALVGDAAGYYDPFTGQGIYQAMAGAERLVDRVGPVLALDAGLAGALDAALAAALDGYARDHRDLTRPARRVQRAIEAVLSRPRLADAALRRLGRAPAVTDRIIEVTGDLRRPRSLLSPRLLSSFLMPSTPETL